MPVDLFERNVTYRIEEIESSIAKLTG